MSCTNGCINTQVGGDHAYCECPCHVGSLPAIPPSRERRVVKFVSVEGGRGAWAMFYLERLINSGLLERAKQRGEFVPNYEKIIALVDAQKGNQSDTP